AASVLSPRASTTPSREQPRKELTMAEDQDLNGPLEKAVTSSVYNAAWLADSDDATIELAKTYARRIDKGTREFESGELTSTDYNKVLYLGPHLLNTLKALGATPEERKSLTSGDSNSDDAFDELKKKRRQKAQKTG